jgi:hypothetical protein
MEKQVLATKYPGLFWNSFLSEYFLCKIHPPDENDEHDEGSVSVNSLYSCSLLRAR